MKKKVTITLIFTVLIFVCGAIAYYFLHTHNYTETITREASCEENGETTYTCWCGASYVEPIEATGHVYISAVVADAECEVVGKIEYTCSICGDVYHEEIPALEHVYEETITDATCGIAGAKVYTCTLCGDNYSEEIPALEHEYEVTEDNDDETVYTCKNCQDSYSEKKEKPKQSEPIGNGWFDLSQCGDGTIPQTGGVPSGIRFY